MVLALEESPGPVSLGKGFWRLSHPLPAAPRLPLPQRFSDDSAVSTSLPLVHNVSVIL